MVKNLQLRLFTVSFLIAAFTLSCNNATKLMLSGEYDQAMYKSVKKLRKKPSKEKFVLILEEAFAKANTRENEQIRYLKKEGAPDNWPQIYDAYTRMKHRQKLIEPLMPLYIMSENRAAVFEFKDYDDEIIQAKTKAVEYLYEHAIELINKNDRIAARQAFHELERVKRLYPNFRDVDNQMNIAKDLGTNKVIFRMVNGTGIPLPPDFEDELTKISLHDLNTKWINYFSFYDTGMFYDYSIIVNMRIIDVGPELIKEIHYKEEKKVKDGWEYVLDKNGNVMKDSLGNDIKVPKYKMLVAFVTENQQTKIARISGTVDYYDNRTNQLIKSTPVTADAIFKHFSAFANGDLKALKSNTRKKLKRKPIPFPNDFGLLLEAGATLRPLVKDVIWHNKYLIKE